MVTTPTIVRQGPGCSPVESVVREAKPECAVVAVVLLREVGVHDRDGQLRVEVALGEGAPLDQLLGGDREEAAGDLLEVGVGPVAPLPVLLALDLDRAAAREHHAEAAGEGGRVELGVRGQLPLQPVVEDPPRIL